MKNKTSLLICHNCKNHMGLVDGGALKRINRELIKLEEKKNFDINNINKNKSLNKENKLIAIKLINKDYNKLIENKENEKSHIVKSKCFYCRGEGNVEK